MRAAEYVRMSTDFQQYSTANQQARIREYAAAAGYSVVRTYLDEGKSGLRLRGRYGLQQLLADVMQGTDEFQAILVYDVSRWGRFMDLDEGAHYEFLCRSAGKRVIYCAEPFEGDSSPYAAIVKGLRRIMAREYSRDLSDKVFAGQSRLAREGFHVGGAPGLGYRRMVVDRQGNPHGILDHQEYKARQDHHVVLVPGPAHEIETVNEIFRWFVEDHLNYTEITRRLNAAAVQPPPHLKKWTTYVIRRMLIDEKYIGCNVYNRTTGRFRQTRAKNPGKEWIRCENAFTPLIDPSMFVAAGLRARSDLRVVDTVRAQTKLKALLEKQGRLSRSLMREAGLPDPSVYEARFGSLKSAFQMVGFEYQLDYERISTQAWACRNRRQQLIQRLVRSFREQGEQVSREREYILVLRGHYRIAIHYFRPVRNRLRFDPTKVVDVTVCVRAAPSSGDDEFFVIGGPPAGRTVCVGEGAFEKRYGAVRCGLDQLPTLLLELLR